MADLAGSTTSEHLEAAVAAATTAGRRARRLAARAEEEGYGEVADVLRSIADTEEAHAEELLDLLGAGTTVEGLKAMIERHLHEATDRLPAGAQTARDEGFDDVAERLDELGRAERSYVDRLTAALGSLTE